MSLNKLCSELVFSVSAFHTNSQDSTVVFIVVYISSYGGRPVASWWRQICKKSQNIYIFFIYKAGLHYALCGYMKITITLEMKRFFFFTCFHRQTHKSICNSNNNQPTYECKLFKQTFLPTLTCERNWSRPLFTFISQQLFSLLPLPFIHMWLVISAASYKNFYALTEELCVSVSNCMFFY